MRPVVFLAFILTFVFTASSAFAQLADLARQTAGSAVSTERTVSVYTNADLKPSAVRADLPANGQTAAPTGPHAVRVRVWTYVFEPTRYSVHAAPPSPRSMVIYGSPTAGPFGEFKPFAPARRLDGTRIDDPVSVYGPNVVVTPFPWIR
jgi:hypothetical protein